jgi:hypothetical protein
MAKASSNDISRWKNLILEQMGTDLSIPVWCRQKEIPIYNFRYWHKKLFPEAMERSAFIEMSDQQASIGIHLECQGVKIHLEPQFDLQALQICLEVIKKC